MVNGWLVEWMHGWIDRLMGDKRTEGLMDG